MLSIFFTGNCFAKDLTPFEAAVIGGDDMAAIDALAKAEISRNGRLSDNILFMAIEAEDTSKSRKEAIKKLIELGADVNVRAKSGLTPLMLASAGVYPETVDILINAGADINAVIKKSADYDYSDDDYGQKSIIEFMQELNIEQLSPLSIAIEKNLYNESSAIAWMLHRRGAKVNYIEYTDICIKRLEDVGNPKNNKVTSDDYINKILRDNARRHNEYLQKCLILVDEGLIIKDKDGHYTTDNEILKKQWGWSEEN